jgi:hypothetical protein
MTRFPLGRLLTLLGAAIVALAVLAAPTPASSNWTLRQLAPKPTEGGSESFPASLSGISCPSDSLCVAVGGLDTLAFSQAPSGGAARWHVVYPSYPTGPGKTCGEGEPHCYPAGGRLKAVSCASEDLCVVASYEGFLYASTEPAGGADAWSATGVNEGHGNVHLTAVSCPSPSFCVAVAGGSTVSDGKVLTSTDPAGGRWQLTQLGGELDLRGISCGTPTLCVAVARGGRMLVSTDPTGGAAAWRDAGTPGGAGDLEGVSCVLILLCAAGNLGGNVLISIDPAGGAWSEANAGGSVQITDLSCPTASRCVAVDNNGGVLTSTDPTAGAKSWRFENLVPFEPTEAEGQPPRNALFGVSCASTSLCALVGSEGRIFTTTDPFAALTDPSSADRLPKLRRRPRTILVFAEHFWRAAVTRHRHVRARFRFYSPSRVRGFECKRDRGRWRPCASPLRYWTGHGRHALRVRAVGPTGLRGRPSMKRFSVRRPARR